MPKTHHSLLLQFKIHSFSKDYFSWVLKTKLMLRPRILSFSSASALFSCHPHRYRHFLSSQYRWISSTPPLQASWMDKIKGVFTGQKTSSPDATSASTSSESFTLLRMLFLSPVCQFFNCPFGSFLNPTWTLCLYLFLCSFSMQKSYFGDWFLLFWSVSYCPFGSLTHPTSILCLYMFLRSFWMPKSYFGDGVLASKFLSPVLF